MGLLNTICYYIDLDHDDAASKRSKKEFFQQQTLTTFLAGLKEPLGATIRAMRPPNLSSAIQYIQEENNIRYLQRNHGPPQIQTANRNPMPTMTHRFSRPQMPTSQPQQGPNFTSEELFNIEQYDQYNGETSTSHENLGHFPEDAPPEDYTEEPLEYVQEAYDGNFHQENENIPET
ncbi:hypothetical protein JTB14_011866 [Gonioctena quinquepunctata]|nr:hypothetical protein JTB14_011866 [Gonioctena quinquepunctata]